MIPTTTDPRAAAQTLLSGGLVLLPTETVYGLAARADDPRAVARVYAAKGRPERHPVIVHVADPADAIDPDAPGSWVSGAPEFARALAEEFWPGPLTLVLPRSSRATDDITGGQDTVAIRVPAHPLAREVLLAMDELDPAGAPHAIVAPSANRFGRVSSTSVQHALDELGDILDDGRDIALDGGPCDVGLESTIVDCSADGPRVLRPGGITAADVLRVAGAMTSLSGSSAPRVPGALPSHYAPAARVAIAIDGEAAAAYAEAATEGGLGDGSIGLLAPASTADLPGVVRLAAPDTSEDYARILYSALREADARGIEFIVVVPPPTDANGIAAAIVDRLRRASAPRT
ncbi:MAG: L-threonylcarbamoyladenylate synthase [Actinomycetota bacterium]